MPINNYIDTIWANSGDVVPIPDPTQGSGTVSYNQGFPIGYSTPVSSGGFNVPRTAINQVLKDITTVLQQYQQHGTPPFITSVMNGGSPYSYSAFDRALLGGVVYQSLVSSNTDTPPSSKWVVASINNFPSLGQCQFQYSSSTICILMPLKGNQVTFPSGAIATIGSSGISTTYNNAYINGVAAQTLAASTLYYAYLWNNGSAYVIDWSTTAYAKDSTTGIEIKTGDATRLLVGMAVTNGSSQFTSTQTTQQVRSWFNDTGVTLFSNFTTQRTTTSTVPVEINTEIRCNALIWAGEAVQASISGAASNSIGTSTNTWVNIDGSNQAGNSETTGTNIATITIIANNITLTEGNHIFTLYGDVSTASTGTWQSTCQLNVNTRR